MRHDYPMTEEFADMRHRSGLPQVTALRLKLVTHQSCAECGEPASVPWKDAALCRVCASYRRIYRAFQGMTKAAL